MNKYKGQSFDQLMELMKSKTDLCPQDAKDLYEAYRESFEAYLEQARQRQSQILSILGSHYSAAIDGNQDLRSQGIRRGNNGP